MMIIATARMEVTNLAPVHVQTGLSTASMLDISVLISGVQESETACVVSLGYPPALNIKAWAERASYSAFRARMLRWLGRSRGSL